MKFSTNFIRVYLITWVSDIDIGISSNGKKLIKKRIFNYSNYYIIWHLNQILILVAMVKNYNNNIHGVGEGRMYVDLTTTWQGRKAVS